MCGICGFYHSQTISKQALKAMSDAQRSRGPDGSGEALFTHQNYQIGLAHRRLKILDLSSAGSQPMYDQDKTVCVSYNGEIYNFAEIKADLSEYSFQSATDTEVILYAYKKWGIDCIKKFNGMFAIALYDLKKATLYLIRDRLGIKPLYYYQNGSDFAFASQLKSLRTYPSFHATIDQESLGYYLCTDYIPAPYSIYKNVQKLQAGTYLEINKGVITSHRYWDIEKICSQKRSDISEEKATNELHTLLKDSISKRMISDVALGTFLSGGIDSTLVSAIAQKLHSKPIDTFSLGFSDKFDEAPFAKKIAKHIGSAHHELYLSKKELLDLVLELPQSFDEPFSDSSMLPTLALSKFTRKTVTVSLSGDGGDELFCGYNRYTELSRLSKFKVLSLILHGAQKIFPRLSFLSPDPRPTQLLAYHNQTDTILEKFLTTKRLLGDTLPDISLPKEFQNACNHVHDPILNAMNFDLLHYVRDNHLTKLDRATMSISLEGRVPLLDHRIVEFANTLPLSILYKDNEKKYLLKKILYEYVPKEMVEREKHGFGSPIHEWLQKELAPLVERYLGSAYLSKQKIFSTKGVSTLLDRFWSKPTFLYGRIIWNLLIFQLWYENYHSTS